MWEGLVIEVENDRRVRGKFSVENRRFSLHGDKFLNDQKSRGGRVRHFL